MRLLATTALAALTALPAYAQDWREDYPVVRIGVSSSENQADRLARYVPFEEYLEETLGVDVEVTASASYDGLIQALAADQVDFTFMGSSAYAAAYTETDGNVIPLLAEQDNNGSTGYLSIIVVPCDSGLSSIDDLQGKVLAFADPDSTSGYAVPYFNLVQQGYDPEKFFSATPFSGSHETGVLAVANGQFDAAATYEDNDISGVRQLMVEKGMIEEGVVCKIWTSPEITNGPFTARANLPQGLIDEMKAAVMAAPEAAPEAFWLKTGGETSTAQGYIEVDHERYQWIVEMRDWLTEQRRG